MFHESAFSYGQHSSADFFLHIEKYPRIKGGARKVQPIEIPGRSGPLHIDEQAYSNYPQEYAVYYHGPFSATELAHSIKEWLLTPSGYQRLQDTYDPEHFRMASFQGPVDVENIMNRYGRAVLSFDCCAKSYLISGEQPIALNAEGALTNPTSCPAQPMITVYGSSAGELYVNGYTVKFKSLDDQIVLDCENMNAYRQIGNVIENRNSSISALEFPVLNAGSNLISWSGGISKVIIKPRWWTL